MPEKPGSTLATTPKRAWAATVTGMHMAHRLQRFHHIGRSRRRKGRASHRIRMVLCPLTKQTKLASRGTRMLFQNHRSWPVWRDTRRITRHRRKRMTRREQLGIQKCQNLLPILFSWIAWLRLSCDTGFIESFVHCNGYFRTHTHTPYFISFTELTHTG